MSLTILQICCEAVGQNLTSEQSDVKPLVCEFLLLDSGVQYVHSW